MGKRIVALLVIFAINVSSLNGNISLSQNSNLSPQSVLAKSKKSANGSVNWFRFSKEKPFRTYDPPKSSQVKEEIKLLARTIVLGETSNLKN